MIFWLELAGSFCAGALTVSIAGAVVAVRKMRAMQKMMRGFPFPQS